MPNLLIQATEDPTLQKNAHIFIEASVVDFHAIKRAQGSLYKNDSIISTFEHLSYNVHNTFLGYTNINKRLIAHLLLNWWICN